MTEQISSASGEVLAAGGVLGREVAGFVARAGQREMAGAVEEVLGRGGALVVESGTGTGKTFAYLVPIVLSGRRTIISTGTRHLQDQIFQRDLPQVARALAAPVDAVLLKGRANYLCRYRLGLQMQQGDWLGEGGDEDQTETETETKTQTDSESFRTIERWAAATRSGDISEVAGISEASPLWKRVTSTADNCLGAQCPDFKRCFVVKARQRAMQADIVVVNHHLFFSDLSLKADGFGELLPQHDAVVFDEAHSLAETASVFFGFSVSGAQVVELGRDALAAEKAERSGVALASGAALLEKAVRQVQRASKAFAGQSVDFDALQNAAFDRAGEGLADALAQFEQTLAAAAPAGEGLKRCLDRCLLLQSSLDAWLSGRDSNVVRWAEIGERRFRFHSTPLNISRFFVEMMAREPHRGAWIFTSATLAVGDDFSAFCNRLGLHDAETRRWESPYDFRRNALLYLPADMPDPRAPEYADALTAVVAAVIRESRGRAFCLFTSYEMMNRVHARLGGGGGGDHGGGDHNHNPDDWPLLLQGQAPKNELLERFRRGARSVLLGTASFWEGVDVVGERLSCVIIDKLPFASPGDPVLKNRLSACEEDGGNPFMDIQIPSAILALKQGAGRLIRSETDRGVLVLCDPRVLSKGYGRRFLDNLPDMPSTREMDAVAAFFADER